MWPSVEYPGRYGQRAVDAPLRKVHQVEIERPRYESIWIELVEPGLREQLRDRLGGVMQAERVGAAVQCLNHWWQHYNSKQSWQGQIKAVLDVWQYLLCLFRCTWLNWSLNFGSWYLFRVENISRRQKGFLSRWCCHSRQSFCNNSVLLNFQKKTPCNINCVCFRKSTRHIESMNTFHIYFSDSASQRFFTRFRSWLTSSPSWGSTWWVDFRSLAAACCDEGLRKTTVKTYNTFTVASIATILLAVCDQFLKGSFYRESLTTSVCRRFLA